MVKNVLTLKFDLSVFCFSKFISRDLTNEVRVYFKVMICFSIFFEILLFPILFIIWTSVFKNKQKLHCNISFMRPFGWNSYYYFSKNYIKLYRDVLVLCLLICIQKTCILLSEFFHFLAILRSLNTQSIFYCFLFIQNRILPTQKRIHCIQWYKRIKTSKFNDLTLTEFYGVKTVSRLKICR